MRVLLGCDGGGTLGVGHVMRSLALAESAVDAGHDVVVAGHFEGSFLQAQLAAAAVEVVRLPVRMADGDLGPLTDLVRSLRPDVLHLDSYEIEGQLRDIVASAGVGPVVVSNVEDGAFGRRFADVVVDPTLGAELTARRADGSTWLLRGSRYTPVRRRVLDAARRAHPGADEGSARHDPAGELARSVLVVMGGTDPMGLTPAAVGLLARTGLALDVTAIAVGENADRVRTAADGSRISLRVLAPVDDLAQLMSAQDLVVSAAGTSIWELFCIGTATAVVWAVDNQREGYDRVVEAGAAIGLGGPELGGDERGAALLRGALTSARARAALVSAGRSVVDGLGAWRVVRMWEQARSLTARPPSEAGSTGSSGLVARPATLQDAQQLWQWRNDPSTRAGSRSSAQVPWEDHLRWLTSSLARADRILLVDDDADGPVGTVRWDLVQEPGDDPGGSHDWEVSITVAPQRRGQSLARPLLRAAEVALSEAASGKNADDGSTVTWSGGGAVRAYLALVNVANQASMRLFESSAYVPDLPPDPRGFMRFRKPARVA